MEFDFQAEIPADEATSVIPKEFLGLYAKSDDGKAYRLHDGLAKKLDVTGLTGALDKERKAGKEATKALAAYSKYGKPEEIQAKLEALEKGAGEGAEGAKRLEKMKQSLLEEHQKALVEKDGVIGRMRQSLDTHLIDAEAVQAVSELKGSARLLLPHIRSSVRVVEEGGKFVVRVVDAEGDPRMTPNGYMSIKDFVGEMRKHPDFAAAFQASGTSGGGTRPGNSGGTPGAGPKSAAQKIADGLAARKTQ